MKKKSDGLDEPCCVLCHFVVGCVLCIGMIVISEEAYGSSSHLKRHFCCVGIPR